MLKLYAIIGCMLLYALGYTRAHLVEDCAAENSVSESDLSAYRNHHGFDRAYFDDKQNVKCFQFCFHLRANFVDENGQLLYETVRPRYAKLPAFARILNECLLDTCQNVTLNYADPCEASYQLALCINGSVDECSSVSPHNNRV